MADASRFIPGLKKGQTLGNATGVTRATAATAQTSAASVGVPTKVEFDKTVADIASLYAGLTALRTQLINEGLI